LSDDKVLNVGDTAPDFTLRTIGLKEVGLAEFRRQERGDPVLSSRLDAGLKHMHACLRQAHRRLSGGQYPGAGYQH